jgi:DNA-binding IclR family transcriptional regulator
MAKAQRGIQSIEVGGALLAALADADGSLSLRTLAQRAGMTSAKAHPYLVSLGKLGLVEQDPPTGHYGLGPFALQLGLTSLQRLDPVRVAIALTHDLAADIAQTVALAVPGSHGPTIVYLRESTRPVHVNMRTGTVMSIGNTATGRVFAAHLPPAQVAALFARESGDRAVVTAPARGRVSAKALATMIAEVRKHGCARAVGSPVPGINAVSAPVFDHSGALRLAITALGPSGTFDAAWNGEIACKVRAAAALVSQRLGYRA